MVKDLTSEKRPVPDSQQPGLPSPRPDAVPHNLPPQLTSLIGREREIAAVAARLRDPGVRLLTLTGPGGIGKTRLALAAAAQVLSEFPDGVFFVPLAPIRDPELVCSTIAQTLGLREMGARPVFEMLKDFLQKKEILLLIDNFEQVVVAAPSLGELLVSCPGLSFLVTSREALRLSSEHQWAVPPLDLPDPRGLLPIDQQSQCEAVRLFVERARRVKANFALTAGSAAAVVEICSRRLEGVPLAIELAAARVKLFPPQTMSARMDQKLKILAGGSRDLPERQQTIRNTIAWSYDLLDEAEQRLFRRLSVFAGGCTLEAVETVCNPAGDLGLEVVEGLASLVDKSLLREVEAASELRFSMLETVREYGQECLAALAEMTLLRAHHAHYYRSYARKAFASLWTRQHREVGDRLEREHDNLRAALGWSLECGDLEQGMRLAGSLGEFWQRRGYMSEARGWLDRLLQSGGTSPSVGRSAALNSAGVAAYVQADYAAARVFLEQSLAESQQLLTEGVGQRKVVRALVGTALTLLGYTVLGEGDFALARSLEEQSASIFHELGMPWGVCSAMGGLASTALMAGEYELARSWCEQSLALAREYGHIVVVPASLLILGGIALAERDWEGAGRFIKESLTILRDTGDLAFIPDVLAWRATHLLAVGQPERSGRILGAVKDLEEATGLKTAPWSTRKYEESLTSALAVLGEQALAAALAEGKAMSMDQAIEYALAEEPVAGDVEPSAAVVSNVDSSPLTRREREIATLIAQGLANREVAAQLVISDRTVETHLTNIMSKLEFNSRSQVAVWATKHLA